MNQLNIKSASIQSPIVIAEIGVNHNGNTEQAKQLIDAAKSAGAHAVKFQYFKAEDLARGNPKKVTYQTQNEGNKRTHFEMLKELEFTLEQHQEVCAYSHKHNILFGTTIYNHNDSSMLSELDLDFIKVASADIVDHRILQSIAKNDWFIIISSGASTYQEVFEASVVLKNKLFCLMQCTSNYPATYESLNVSVLDSYKSLCNIVGYSDHSCDSLASQLALAKGACIFEKHLTLDKKLPGPDHIASLNPLEFKNYVDSLIRAVKILGKPHKEVQPEELDMRRTSRKSLHFNRNIGRGEQVNEEDLFLSRPGHGIYAKELQNIIGKYVTCNVNKGDLVSNELLTDKI